MLPTRIDGPGAGRRRGSRRAMLAAAAVVLAGSSALAQEDRVPLAVMDLSARGVDEAAAAALGTEVSTTLASLKVFRVITREDIKRMLQLEQTRQQCTGEADEACLAEIGGALGVDFLVYGEIARVAETYNLSLVLLDIGRAEARNRASARIDDPGDLLEQTGLTARRLVRPLLGDKRGSLVVRAEESGAEVRVDDRLVGITPLSGPLELPMGPHELQVEKEGFLAFAQTVDVEPGASKVVSIALVPSETFIADYERSARTIRTTAWASAGASALLLGTGLALGLVADARFDDLVGRGWLAQDPAACAGLRTNSGDYCPTSLGYQNGVLEEVDGVETTDTIALTALIVGGVAAVASAVLFLTGDNPDRYETFGEPAASPTPGTVHGRF